MTAPDLDPRRYGYAPLEKDVHDGVIYLTMAGLMRRLGIYSETTIRKNTALMALRHTLSPGTHRWKVSEVDAYVAAQPSQSRKRTRRELGNAMGDAHGPRVKIVRKIARREQTRSALAAEVQANVQRYREEVGYDPRTTGG